MKSNNKRQNQKKISKKTKSPYEVEVIKTDVDPDILMIRALLALPMNKRTNFLRVPVRGTKGSAL